LAGGIRHVQAYQGGRQLVFSVGEHAKFAADVVNFFGPWKMLISVEMGLLAAVAESYRASPFWFGAVGFATTLVIINAGWGLINKWRLPKHQALAVAGASQGAPIQLDSDRFSLAEQGAPDANLSLAWQNNVLALRVENKGRADATFEATIDLSNAGVQVEAGHQYAPVWAGDQNATARKIFEGDSGFIKLYSHEEYPRNIYTAIFYCQTGDVNRFVKTKHYSEDGPWPHIIDISVSSSPRMIGGAKRGRIQVKGGEVTVIHGDIQGTQ
jgi:hypothetical protein